MIKIARADVTFTRDYDKLYDPSSSKDWGRAQEIRPSPWTRLQVGLDIEFDKEEATKHVVGLLRDSLNAVIARGKREPCP